MNAPTDHDPVRPATHRRKACPLCFCASFGRSLGFAHQQLALQDRQRHSDQPRLLLYGQPEPSTWQFLFLPPAGLPRDNGHEFVLQERVGIVAVHGPSHGSWRAIDRGHGHLFW